jgi:4-hydroxybenzoyl-CoA reductase subunit beta
MLFIQKVRALLLPEHTYHKPVSLEDCLSKLAELTAGDSDPDKVRVVAGGTDVIFNMRLQLFQPEDVISIRRLPELQKIEELADGSLRIGAACRLIDLADDPRVQSQYPSLKQAIDAVASVHIRNIGTLGGNICLETRCWFTNNSEDWRQGREGCFKTDCEQCHVIPSSQLCHAINNADTPIALISLNAVLTIQSMQGSRELPIAEFYNNDGMHHMALESGEIVTHITLPPCDERAVFLKFTPRKGMDFSIGAVAVRSGGHGEAAENVSIVLGSVSSAPIFLYQAAEIIEAEGLTDAAIERAVEAIRAELGELTNLYGKATYKKQIAKTLVRRALRAIREQ